MESNHLTTRTYTALTCKLIVSTTSNPSGLGSQGFDGEATPKHQQTPVDFTLQLDRSDCGDSEDITLQGNLLQLNLLQQVVSKYITELVAKFPLPDMSNNITSDSISSATIDQDISVPKFDTENSILLQRGSANDDRNT